MSTHMSHPSRRRLLGAGVVAAGTLAGGALASGRVAVAEAAPRARHTLVANDLGQAVIVVEEPGSTFVTDAATELQSAVAQATGVTLPIVQPDDTRPRSMAVRIGLGPVAVQEMALRGVVLEPEEYWIQSRGQDLLIVGYDIDPATTTLPDVGTPLPYNPTRSPATMWGVQYVLDRHFGVRWLWPGVGGTVVPATGNLVLPTLSVRGRPGPVLRQLRSLHYVGRNGPVRLVTAAVAAEMEAEVHQWQERHQLGQRTNAIANHSFTTWWSRFSATHPDYFAVPPAGYAQVAPGRVKLRLSNPAVADQIVADWEAAGRPDLWSVGPNDSSGFDTHPATMAMDFPAGQDPVDVWSGRTDLSSRYVSFWNQLLARMRQTNPNVRLKSLAYSAYKTAPPPGSGITSAAGLILSYTVAPWWHAEWQAWSDLGASLVLRPNWWNSGSTSPVLPLSLEGDFHLFARQHGSLGFDYDSMYGGWGNQALRYYLAARLNARPDLGVDDVITEFVGCFGSAASAIGDYVAFWQQHTTAVSYPLGSPTPIDPQGLYATTVAQHGTAYSSTLGSIQILPYVYTDAVLGDAHAILDQAVTQAGADTAVLARIQFLRDGLIETAAQRDTVAATPGTTAFTTAAGHLRDVRAAVTRRHVVWGEFSYWNENRLNVKTIA